MTAVIDATVGGATSNCYCTLAEAELYFAARGFSENWTDATDDAKSVSLIWATRLMDLQVWRGMKRELTNVLRWPRMGLVDRDGGVVNYDTIPVFIKNATCEWALYLLGEDRTLDEGGLVQYGGKIGPISDPATYARKPMPDSVRDFVAPYLMGGPSGSGRVSRA
jgi:hypothetical protein